MMTRKEFVQTVAGAATATALSGVASSAPVKGKPKRGVSVYSFTGDYGVSMNLEDCLAHISDMDAEGVEILANSHIDNYPNPTTAWIDHWFSMMTKYKLKPAEYGHWVDSRLRKGGDLNTKESYEMLVRDIKLANKLGFPCMRTKLGVIDETLTPVKNWREFIKMALPEAEKYNVVMLPEIHLPTLLNSAMIDDILDFVVTSKTKHFGFNIDFSVFEYRQQHNSESPRPFEPGSKVSELVRLVPYTYCCHAKFHEVLDDLTEYNTPYDEIIKTLADNGYNGYMLAEYEGPGRQTPEGEIEPLRRHQAMMKRILASL